VVDGTSSSQAAANRRQLGARAEQAVALHLEAQGFQIVARNLRLGALELDIVARRGDLIAVVEVRSRSRRSWTTAHGSILPAKKRRLRRAALRLWRSRYRCDPSVRRLRLDAAAVSFTAEGAVVDYCPAAFSL
jgi:putative endonuclease